MIRRVLLAGIALAGATPAAAAPTVLDFTGVTTNEPINASYGDRIITTPNVVTDFSPLGDNGWQGYDEANETYDGRDWFGVAQLDGDGTAYDITFTPDGWLFMHLIRSAWSGLRSCRYILGEINGPFCPPRSSPTSTHSTKAPTLSSWAR